MRRPYRGKHRRPRRVRAAPAARLTAVGLAAVVGGYGGWQAASVTEDGVVPAAANQPTASVPRAAATGDSADTRSHESGDAPTASARGATDGAVHDSWHAVASPDGESAAPRAMTRSAAGARGSADQDPPDLVIDHPARLTLPSIGVSAPLVPLGVNQDGTLETPSDFDAAGWWQGGAEPGEQGPAVIAGHVDSHTGPAVFYALDELSRGDAIQIYGEDGGTVRFTVKRVEQHAKDSFPTQGVYGDTSEPTLRLITCTGPFNEAQGRYRDNLIVYADLSPQPE